MLSGTHYWFILFACGQLILPLYNRKTEKISVSGLLVTMSTALVWSLQILSLLTNSTIILVGVKSLVQLWSWTSSPFTSCRTFSLHSQSFTLFLMSHTWPQSSGTALYLFALRHQWWRWSWQDSMHLDSSERALMIFWKKSRPLMISWITKSQWERPWKFHQTLMTSELRSIIFDLRKWEIIL